MCKKTGFNMFEMFSIECSMSSYGRVMSMYFPILSVSNLPKDYLRIIEYGNLELRYRGTKFVP